MIISCPDRLLKGKKENYWVFCAGPIQGAPDWQHSLPSLKGITFMSPRRESYENFNYQEQTTWEHDHMLASDIIMFWIPEETEHIEGRSYAQTTRTEFGEYLARGKKIVFGCYSGFPGEKYFASKLKDYTGNDTIHRSLKSCLEEVKKIIENWEKESKILFTSDTHFGSQRTLELSKRPFINTNMMDWTMIQRWNDKVHPSDVVYHLGDFGDTWPLKYLNGYIFTIDGNYERDGKSDRPREGIEKAYGDHLYLDDDYLLVHEPTHAEELFKKHSFLERRPVLFGHIHGRQKIKPFGIDVGVDCNNFSPISEEEVKFYLNAIEKGYYDKDVWCQ